MDSPTKPSLLYATAPAMGMCLPISQTPFTYWAAVPGLLLLQGDMFRKAIVFDIWLCFFLLGKSSRPLLSGELGLLYCPEQSSGVSKAAQARATHLGAVPVLCWNATGMSWTSGNFWLGRVGRLLRSKLLTRDWLLAATVESSCSCEQNLPWV